MNFRKNETNRNNSKPVVNSFYTPFALTDEQIDRFIAYSNISRPAEKAAKHPKPEKKKGRP